MRNTKELKFCIKMGGTNDIDAKVFIDVINGTLELSKIICAEYGEETNLNLRIDETRKGSFIVALTSQVSWIPNLLTMENMSYAKTILDTFVCMIDIKKHLKGNKPTQIKKGDRGMVAIQNADNANINVAMPTYNIYANDGDRILSKMFDNYNKQNFEISSENTTKVVVENNELPYLRKHIELEPIEDCRIIENTSDVWLRAKKPDLLGNSKWDFIYAKNKSKVISASIEDKEFLQKVNNGDININAKTNLYVQMHVLSYLDELNTPLKEVFTIKKILDIKYLQSLDQVNLNC